MRLTRKLLHLFRRIVGTQAVIDVLAQQTAGQAAGVLADANDRAAHLTVHGPHQIEDLKAHLDRRAAALQFHFSEQMADLPARIAKLVSAQTLESADVSCDARPGRAEPPGGNLALVVPVDHQEVVPLEKNREPYQAITEIFEKSLGAMKVFCRTLEPFFDIPDVPDEQVDQMTPFWNNGYFTADDAKVAYAIVREYEPAQVLECGSGNSTKFFRKAIGDGGLSTRLTSIDPCPRAEISGVADVVIPSKIQDAPIELFDSLAAGDVLFLDGSHLAFHGTDVPHFFMRLLPRVRPGVFVHVHDISLPDEYPEVFDKRYYNEQYVLAAFLLCNKEWEVLAPVHWLRGKGVLPIGGNSFWMKRAA